MPEHGRDGNLIRSKYPDELKRRLVELFERRRHRACRPITAIVIAKALGIYPDKSRETRRRRVRELVDELRREGAAIASHARGYWPAETVDDFERHRSFMRRHGLAVLATAARMRDTVAYQRAIGQQLLPTLAHAGVVGGLDFYLDGRDPSPPNDSPPGEPESTDFGPLFGPG